MFNRFAVFTTMLWAAILSSTPNLKAQQSEVKNIVLVHGAWADGSGWKGVYDNLVRELQIFKVQQQKTIVVGNLEDQREHTGLRVVQIEQTAKQQGTHF